MMHPLAVPVTRAKRNFTITLARQGYSTCWPDVLNHSQYLHAMIFLLKAPLLKIVFKGENEQLYQNNNTNLPSGLFNLIMESLAQDVYCGEAGLFTSFKKKKKKKTRHLGV